MDDFRPDQAAKLATIRPTQSKKKAAVPVVTPEECKQYFERFQLSDERVATITNSVIGIVDSVLNAYLDNFR